MKTTQLAALRPVGNPIRLASPHTTATDDPLIGTLLDSKRYHVYWVDCGTAALALAMLAACQNATTAKPEVIVPAYGCPDLIAAALFANVRPVLVDIRQYSPNYSPDLLAAAITPDTVAIVSAALLGMRGNEAELRTVIGEHPIMLIEDSAQWFPRTPSQTFFGDSVVLSFGRGKPLNLLGGGALLCRNPLPAELLPPAAPRHHNQMKNLKYLLKAATYNMLIAPYPYGVVSRLPMLDIGSTRYHPLSGIDAMLPMARKLLGSNLRQYCERSLDVQSRWTRGLREISHHDRQGRLLDLARHNDVPLEHALLRYPIAITNHALRNCIFDELRQQGLGASIMYPATLPLIPGLPAASCTINCTSNATLLAGRLLTLPTHDAVDMDIIERTLAIIRKHLS